MGFGLDDIKRGASGAVRTVARAGGDAVNAVERVVPDRAERLGRDVLDLGGEALGEAGDVARVGANVVRHLRRARLK